MSNFFDEKDIETNDISDGFFDENDIEVEAAPISKTESALRGGAQGLSFGFADEAQAAAEAIYNDLMGESSGDPVTFDEQGRAVLPENQGGIYNERLQEIRDQYKAAQEANPVTSTVSEIGAGILPALVSGGASLVGKGTQVAGKVATKELSKEAAKKALKEAAMESSKLGAKYGGVAGMGYSEGETPLEVAADTALGVAGGGVIGGVAPKAMNLAGKGLKALGKAPEKLMDTMPSAEAIKASFKYGTQGKKVIADNIDDDMVEVGTALYRKLMDAKSANSLSSVRDELSELGYKVNAKGVINEAISDLEKIAQGDLLDLQNKKLVPNLKKLAGVDIEGEKLTEKAMKAAMKKQVENEGKVAQQIIKGEKSLAKDAIKSGDDLVQINDMNSPMDALDLPLDTANGRIAGVKGKFQGPEGEYTKTVLGDATDYQPQISKILGPDGRPIIKTLDEGSGKVSAIVGQVDNMLKQDLENLTIREVEDMRNLLNKATKLAQGQGSANDPIVKRATQLAVKLRDITDDVLRKSGKTELIDKRARISDVMSAEDLSGIGNRLNVRTDIDQKLKGIQLAKSFGIQKDTTGRNINKISEELMGEDVMTPAIKEKFGMMQELNSLLGRSEAENFTRSKLYDKAIRGVPNAVGRAKAYTGQLAPVKASKNLVNKVGSMTDEGLTKAASMLNSSNKSGYQAMGRQLSEAMAQEGPIKNAMIWSLSQQPAFRKATEQFILNQGRDTEEGFDSAAEYVRQKFGGKTEDESFFDASETESESIEPQDEAMVPYSEGMAPQEELEPSRAPANIESLKENEGFVSKVYKDQLGKDTIGYGHLLTAEDKRTKKIHGYDYTNGLTEEEAEEILKIDKKLNDKLVINSMGKKGINYSKFSNDQVEGLSEAAFQLGGEFLNKFPSMANALKDGKFDEAARQAMIGKNDKYPSTWIEQTPIRVKDFIQRIDDDFTQEDALEFNKYNKKDKHDFTQEEIDKLQKSVDREAKQLGSGAGMMGKQRSSLDEVMGNIESINMDEQTKQEMQDSAYGGDMDRLQDLINGLKS